MDFEHNQENDSRWRKLMRIGLLAYLALFFVMMLAIVLGLVLGFRYFNQRINNLAQQQTGALPTQQSLPVVDVTVKPNAPTLGPSEAPVTLIEFADFQCPFCKKFQDEVFPQLKSRYTDTGKAKFIFQDFAFLGEESLQAAAAAKCAADQQQFWPYHDLLYAKQGSENSGTFSNTALKSFAQQLGLNQAEFNQCVDSGKYTQAVQDETTAGQSFGVSATPTLFINGQKYEGVGSVLEYTTVIEQALNSQAK
jgi:protein-disulfide isomerase